MLFRNLTFFRFPEKFEGLFPTAVADELDTLDSRLAEARLKPVGPMELSSRGFVSPFGRDEEVLAHTVADATLITLGGEDRVLPPAVVNDLLERKLDEIEQKEGRRPGGRTRKRLKDELVTELMPRAFVRPTRLYAYVDRTRSFIAVDTSSRRAAESVVSEVRRAIGSFPALPLNSEVAPSAVLTSWLAGEELPEGFELGDECEIREAGSDGAVASLRRQELTADEVAKHLQAGKVCTKLALTYDGRLGFVLGEDLIVRKLKFLEAAVESLENTEREDLAAEMDARFALMAGEVGRLFARLEEAFQLSKVEG